jgi:16S rRNA methyltransferase RsmB/F
MTADATTSSSIDSPTTTTNTTTTTNAAAAILLSLDELHVAITDEVYDYLAAPFRMAAAAAAGENEDEDEDDSSNKTLNRILQRMKTPPKTTILRVTRPYLPNERQDVLQQVQRAMEEWLSTISVRSQSSSSRRQQNLTCQVKFHPVVSDVISIDILIQSPSDTTIHSTDASQVSSLFSRSVPPRPPHLGHDENNALSSLSLAYTKEQWPWRAQSGWPCTHAVVVVDRLCGEAVLRGANVFVKGILVADTNIVKGQEVSVYADLGINGPEAAKTTTAKTTTTTTTTTTRGQHLQHYTGHAVFLGLGTAACSRALFFSQLHGLGVQMSALPCQRAGPVLPPLNMAMEVGGGGGGDHADADDSNHTFGGSRRKTSSTSSLAQLLASGRVYAQNLPSALVAHVLDAQPGHVIFDMCAAPGGKTSHVAQLVRAATAAKPAANGDDMENVQGSFAAAATSTPTTIVVMADKSRKKVVQARELFQRLFGEKSSNGDDVYDKCTITPLHLDSTNCVERRQDVARHSVQEVRDALLYCM